MHQLISIIYIFSNNSAVYNRTRIYQEFPTFVYISYCVWVKGHIDNGTTWIRVHATISTPECHGVPARNTHQGGATIDVT